MAIFSIHPKQTPTMGGGLLIYIYYYQIFIKIIIIIKGGWVDGVDWVDEKMHCLVLASGGKCGGPPGEPPRGPLRRGRRPCKM